MKTVGELLREARIGKGYSRIQLGEETRIKPVFIGAIERGQWENLPEYGVVIGFVKNLAHFLEVEERQAVSIFRREYPPSLIKNEKLKVSSQTFGKKFVWGPRLTFLVGVAIIIVIVLGYLGIQYRKFNLAPQLVVDRPIENQVVKETNLEVSGQTDSDATVEVNNQPVVVADDGKFMTEIEVSKNTDSIDVVAKSRSGKETRLSRKINFVP